MLILLKKRKSYDIREQKEEKEERERERERNKEAMNNCTVI
jgi:hypothetical protein